MPHNENDSMRPREVVLLLSLILNNEAGAAEVK
jgi:hypothetical protein